MLTSSFLVEYLIAIINPIKIFECHNEPPSAKQYILLKIHLVDQNISCFSNRRYNLNAAEILMTYKNSYQK